jgi:hypothetical protein
MKLNTLRGVKKLGGHNVVVMDNLKEKFPDKFNESGAMDYKWFEKDIRPHNFIYVRHDVGSLSFTIQSDPISEVGVNGCQADALIDAAMHMYKHFQSKGTPSTFTNQMISHCQSILDLTEARTKDRESRGVEGTSQA